MLRFCITTLLIGLWLPQVSGISLKYLLIISRKAVVKSVGRRLITMHFSFLLHEVLASNKPKTSGCLYWISGGGGGCNGCKYLYQKRCSNVSFWLEFWSPEWGVAMLSAIQIAEFVHFHFPNFILSHPSNCRTLNEPTLNNVTCYRPMKSVTMKTGGRIGQCLKCFNFQWHGH